MKIEVVTHAGFTAAHTVGPDGPIKNRSTWHYVDGAQASQVIGGRSGDEVMFSDPPADEYSRLLNVKRYWSLRTERAERTFFRERSNYSEALAAASTFANYPAPDVRCLEDLRNLKQDAMRSRKELAETEAALDATPERKRRQAVQDRVERDQAAARQLLQRVNSFRLDDGDDGEPDEVEKRLDRLTEKLLQQQNELLAASVGRKLPEKED